MKALNLCLLLGLVCLTPASAQPEELEGWLKAIAESKSRSDPEANAAAEKIVALGEPAVPALLQRLDAKGSERLRSNVCLLLGQIGARPQQVAPKLLAVFEGDPSASVRRGAFLALSRFPTQWGSVLPKLLAKALAAPDEERKVYEFFFSAYLKEESGQKALAAFLEDAQRDVGDRLALLRMLSESPSLDKKGPWSSLGPPLERLCAGEEAALRGPALLLLAERGSDPAGFVRRALAALESPDASLRKHAIMALRSGLTASRSSATGYQTPPEFARALPKLAALSREGPAELRVLAGIALGELDRDREGTIAPAVLVEALASKDEEVLAAALESLYEAELEPSQAQAILARREALLACEGYAVRRWFVLCLNLHREKLAAEGLPLAARALAKATQDAHLWVRCHALEALAEYGEHAKSEAKTQLYACLKDSHVDVQGNALKTLVALYGEDPAAAPQLVEHGMRMLKSKNGEARAWGLQCLLEFESQDAKVFPLALDLLSDSDENVQTTLKFQFTLTMDRERLRVVAPELVRRLKAQPAPALRLTLLTLLARAKPEGQEATAVFLSALEGSPALQEEALKGLGDRPEQAEAILPKALELKASPNEKVRARLARLISTTGASSKAGAEALLQLFQDANADVRRTAVGSVYTMKVARGRLAEAVRAALRDANAEVRCASVNALLSIESPEQAIPALLPLHEDRDRSVRERLCERLRWEVEHLAPHLEALEAARETERDAALKTKWHQLIEKVKSRER